MGDCGAYCSLLSCCLGCGMCLARVSNGGAGAIENRYRSKPKTGDCLSSGRGRIKPKIGISHPSSSVTSKPKTPPPIREGYADEPECSQKETEGSCYDICCGTECWDDDKSNHLQLEDEPELGELKVSSLPTVVMSSAPLVSAQSSSTPSFHHS